MLPLVKFCMAVTCFQVYIERVKSARWPNKMSLFHTPLSHSSLIKSVCVGVWGRRRLTPQCSPRPGRAILRSQVCIQEANLHTVAPSSDMKAAPYPENVATVPLGLVLSPAQYAKGPRGTHVH